MSNSGPHEHRVNDPLLFGVLRFLSPTAVHTSAIYGHIRSRRRGRVSTRFTARPWQPGATTTHEHTSPLRGVMIFARDPETSCRWYTEHVLRLESTALQVDSGFWFVEVDGVEIGFHPADDERNPFGASVVAYFATGNLSTHREELLAAGARHHRGPLVIDGGRSICQLVDPFGGIFGLDGPP